MRIADLPTDEELRTQITCDEGCRYTPYKDTAGIWTGGVGHNLEAHGVPWLEIETWIHGGIPEDTIQEWFSEDIAAAIHVCDMVFEDFAELPDQAQRVLVNMGFDLSGRLWQWVTLRSSVAGRDWRVAALSIRNSRFFTQAPNRCRRLAERLEALA